MTQDSTPAGDALEAALAEAIEREGVTRHTPVTPWIARQWFTMGFEAARGAPAGDETRRLREALEFQIEALAQVIGLIESDEPQRAISAAINFMAKAREAATPSSEPQEAD